MAYSEINARRVLARKLWECREFTTGLQCTSWHALAERHRREYERHAEKLFDPKDDEVNDALAVLGWRRDGGA